MLLCNMAYHFCIKFPSTHRTISDRSHSMSCEGSYPLVAFPVIQIPSVLYLSCHINTLSRALLTFCICSPADVHHMDQGIGMTQVIQELIPQASSLMRPRDKTCNIQEFNRNGPSALEASSVVRFTLIGNVESLACAVYLKVSNGALGVNGGETKYREWETVRNKNSGQCDGIVRWNWTQDTGRTDRLTGNSLCFRKFYISNQTLEYLNIPLTNFRASICQAI